MDRNINEILSFRTDISPFLVHLTKDTQTETASQILKSILKGTQREIVPGKSSISDAKYGVSTSGWLENKKWKYFGSISFTETPLNEIHCLIDIAARDINLRPYGIVFLKERLRLRGISPCWYLNNETGNKDAIVRALCSLIETHPEEAADILPLIAVFGKKIKAPSAQNAPSGIVDWLWEREWRSPYHAGALRFDNSDVFIGLCPHDEITDFENVWPDINFIDPTRNMKWYASKLIAARKRLNLNYSVV